MKRYPFPNEKPLSLEQFDAYVERARAERARAIAEFAGHLAAWIWRTLAHVARPARPSRERRGGHLADRPVP